MSFSPIQPFKRRYANSPNASFESLTQRRGLTKRLKIHDDLTSLRIDHDPKINLLEISEVNDVEPHFSVEPCEDSASYVHSWLPGRKAKKEGSLVQRLRNNFEHFCSKNIIARDVGSILSKEHRSKHETPFKDHEIKDSRSSIFSVDTSRKSLFIPHAKAPRIPQESLDNWRELKEYLAWLDEPEVKNTSKRLKPRLKLLSEKSIKKCNKLFQKTSGNNIHDK